MTPIRETGPARGRHPVPVDTEATKHRSQSDSNGSCGVRGCVFKGPRCPVHHGPGLSRAHNTAIGFMRNKWTTGKDRDCELDLPADVRDARERFRQTVKDRWAKGGNVDNIHVSKRPSGTTDFGIPIDDNIINRVVPDELDYLLRGLLADALVAS